MSDLTELLREMAGRCGLALTLKERRCLREAADELARLRGALKGMLDHSCVADTAAEDKDEEDHAAERAARAALSGSPPPAEVSGSMVERACKIVHQETWRLQGAEAKAMLRNRMRAALTAAIGGQNG